MDATLKIAAVHPLAAMKGILEMETVIRLTTTLNAATLTEEIVASVLVRIPNYIPVEILTMEVHIPLVSIARTQLRFVVLVTLLAQKTVTLIGFAHPP